MKSNERTRVVRQSGTKRSGSRAQARVVLQEDRRADVVDVVPARELQVGGRERHGRPVLVEGFRRLPDVEVREARGVATQLVARAVLDVVLEEADRGGGCDHARQHDPDQEEGRNAEAE